MKKIIVITAFSMMAASSGAQIADSLALQELVVTGTRNATDVRHLPMTVNVIGRQQLTEQHQTSVLPTVMQRWLSASRCCEALHRYFTEAMRWEV